MGYYPNFRNEKKLIRKGFKYIAGIDEAGKGSWAGPVFAAVVILDLREKIPGIKDSKLLRLPARKKAYEEIIKKAVAWSVGMASNVEIDKLGIDKANKLAMKRALEKISPKPDFIMIDAVKLNYQDIPSLSIIDGDYKVMTIAAASIIAKVLRDQMMDEFDEKYPQYGFKHHKGYGTTHHFHMLNEHGICDLHRKTWEPMKHFLNN